MPPLLQRLARRVVRGGERAGGAFLVGLLLGGLSGWAACAQETRYQVLSTVFDGVPPPGTPAPARRRPGTPLPPATAATTRAAPVVTASATAGGGPQPAVAEAQPGESYPTFDALSALFPKDGMGNLNWVEAVDLGLIDPQPSVNPEARPSPPIQLDIRLDPGIPGFEVVFPHEAHTYWLRCDNCHPEIFDMRAGSNPISMAKIFAGQYCGRCHGKVAFPPQTGCPRCHVRMGRG
jgi:c(7)-type cytochrome triheme protein